MQNIVDQTIWVIEPDKPTLFFVTQSGHGKPLINAFKDVSPGGAAQMLKEIETDNTMFRVFTAWKDHYVFVIYKKHYATRDTAAAIMQAYQAVREKYPDQKFKTAYENKSIFAALKDEDNLEFYKRLSGPIIR